MFLVFYSISRFLIEFLREPDSHLGLFFNFITLGQILSIPFLLFGIFIVQSYASRRKIKSIIKSSKKDMRLDVFLELLLYDKNGYYYQQKPIGKKADFITAPEISQIFGEIIGIYLYYYWAKKINKKFNFIELGPGNGTLFNDITNCLVKFPQFFEKAKVTFVEVNKELKKIQKTKIKNKYLSKISWNGKINFKSKKPSIIYSNEFFDCFPVRQFFLKKIWKEKYVN